MNYKSMGRSISLILYIEAALMLPVLLFAWGYHEPAAALSVAATIGILVVLATPLYLLTRKASNVFHEKEGFLVVGLSWLIMSICGCLPFVFSGAIPRFIDAFFETASGFTTTGSSVLSEVESLPKSLLYWRSFTHWIGGMGVLVFLLAIAPIGGKNSGFSIHLLRAESPGPSVSKLVPQMRKTARILYLIYIGLTLLDFICLLIGGLPAFDALCVAVGTAGTGGFAVTNAGLGGYAPAVQNITTVFMFLFGINFSCYYLILTGRLKSALKDEELRKFFCAVVIAVVGISFSIRSLYGSWEETLRHTFFQVGAISSTTGFATTDFERWPTFAKGFLLFFMVTGACAGSTCGGMKFSRFVLIVKNLRRNILKLIRPNRVVPVRLNKQPVDEAVLVNLNTYLAAYVLILFGSFFLLTLDGMDLTTTFTAVLTCFNNVGPGFGAVGPTGNFSQFGVLSKLVLIFDMLAGRLEIFPVLVLFSLRTWRQK